MSYVRAISTSVSAKSAAIAKCEVETPKGSPPECPGEDPLVVKISAANDFFSTAVEVFGWRRILPEWSAFRILSG